MRLFGLHKFCMHCNFIINIFATMLTECVIVVYQRRLQLCI